jgi:beta-phosphoglucomutase-like phosphatase (HAD superfamily)
VALAVETLGLAAYFSALITGDDVTRGKPAPDIFLKAADALGRNPAKCIVIEDAPQGIKAALAAGMKVIAVTTSRPRAELSSAHRVVEALSELDPPSILALV